MGLRRISYLHSKTYSKIIVVENTFFSQKKIAAWMTAVLCIERASRRCDSFIAGLVISLLKAALYLGHTIFLSFFYIVQIMDII